MTPFVEPTSLLALRWGTYTGRYLGGLALIVSGTIGLQGANANFGIPMLFGTLAHAAGWWIMPAAGWRRVWVVLPSLASILILLIGPAGIAALAVSFGGWLLVRHRPAVTFVLVPVLFTVGVLLRGVFSEYSGMLPALGIMGGLIVASSWLARLAAGSRLFHRRGVETAT